MNNVRSPFGGYLFRLNRHPLVTQFLGRHQELDLTSADVEDGLSEEPYRACKHNIFDTSIVLSGGTVWKNLGKLQRREAAVNCFCFPAS